MARAQVFKSAFSDIEALPTPEPVEPRTPAALMHALATYTSLFTHSPLVTPSGLPLSNSLACAVRLGC